MNLEQLLAELMKLDAAQVATALQEKAQPVFQHIFNKGHGAGLAKATDDKTRLEGQVASLTSQLSEKDNTIRTLTDKAPDVAAVRQTFEAQINQLTEKHKSELKAKDEEIQGERMSRARSDIRTKLVAGGVDPDYADVLMEKPEIKKRMRFAKDGVLEVLQDKQDIPLTATKDKAVTDLFVEELVAAAPAKFLTVNSDRGSGTESGGGGGKGNASRYDKIREDAKSRQTVDSSQPSAAERLRGRRSRTK